jgi:hypothetical protein
MKIQTALYFILIISIIIRIDSSKNERKIRTSSKTKVCPCDEFYDQANEVLSRIMSLNTQIDAA